MPARKTRHPDIEVGLTLGLDRAASVLKTRLPHLPLRWCYGLPLTTDPTRFYPDPHMVSRAQLSAWKAACAAKRHDNQYPRPGRYGDAHSEPWGIGVTIFPESRDWPGTWDVAGPRIVQEG